MGLKKVYCYPITLEQFIFDWIPLFWTGMFNTSTVMVPWRVSVLFKAACPVFCHYFPTSIKTGYHCIAKTFTGWKFTQISFAIGHQVLSSIGVYLRSFSKSAKFFEDLTVLYIYFVLFMTWYIYIIAFPKKKVYFSENTSVCKLYCDSTWSCLHWIGRIHCYTLLT